MTKMIKLDFLKSVRFWKLFIVAVANFLVTQGILGQDLANLITLWLGGSVALGTLDKITKS